MDAPRWQLFFVSSMLVIPGGRGKVNASRGIVPFMPSLMN